MRVVPGDHESSMLWRKVAARTIDLPDVPGSEMPLGEPAVGAAELDAIRAWIAAGAPRDASLPVVRDLLECNVR